MNLENILMILSSGFMLGFIAGCIECNRKIKEKIKHIDKNCNNKAVVICFQNVSLTY